MLMKLDTPATRKSLSFSTFSVGRYSRRMFLDRLCEEISVLAAIGYDRTKIAQTLGILEEDVLALGPNRRGRTMRRDLSRRAVNALVCGRHARLGGRTIGNRAKRLVEIASAYTREELLTESGVGSVTATEIEFWLQARGLTLQPSAATSDET